MIGSKTTGLPVHVEQLCRHECTLYNMPRVNVPCSLVPSSQKCTIMYKNMAYSVLRIMKFESFNNDSSNIVSSNIPIACSRR